MDGRFGEMLDTPVEARAAYYARLAALTPSARARKVASLGRSVRAMARAGIRRSRPEASPLEVELALVTRMYGAEAAQLLAPHLSALRT